MNNSNSNPNEAFNPKGGIIALLIIIVIGVGGGILWPESFKDNHTILMFIIDFIIGIIVAAVLYNKFLYKY